MLGWCWLILVDFGWCWLTIVWILLLCDCHDALFDMSIGGFAVLSRQKATHLFKSNGRLWTWNWRKTLLSNMILILSNYCGLLVKTHLLIFAYICSTVADNLYEGIPHNMVKFDHPCIFQFQTRNMIVMPAYIAVHCKWKPMKQPGERIWMHKYH